MTSQKRSLRRVNMATAALVLAAAGLAGAAPRVLFDATVPAQTPTVQVPAALEDEVFFDAVDVWSLRCEGSRAATRFHDRATGAFTRPNTHEVAWLYTWCAQGERSVQGLLITEDDRPVAHFALRGRYGAVSGVRDQNQNGLNELLLEEVMTIGDQPAARTAEVALLEFRLPDVVTLGRTMVLEGNCDAGSASQLARKVLIEPGRTPRLSTQTYKRVCPPAGQAQGAPSDWRPLSDATPLGAPSPVRLLTLRADPAAPGVPLLAGEPDVPGSLTCRALACTPLASSAGFSGLWEVVAGARPVQVWLRHEEGRPVLTFVACCVQQIPIGNGSVPTRWLQGLLLEATGVRVTDGQLEGLARLSARGGTLDLAAQGGSYRVASRQVSLNGRASVAFDVWRAGD